MSFSLCSFISVNFLEHARATQLSTVCGGFILFAGIKLGVAEQLFIFRNSDAHGLAVVTLAISFQTEHTL